MQEASSGSVRLEHANVAAIKAMVSLLHTDGRSLKEFRLSASDLLDVVMQAAEWQCTSMLPPLLVELAQQIRTTDASVAAHVLQIAAKHKTAGGMREHARLWQQSEDAAIDR